jgi:hypothetical protein
VAQNGVGNIIEDDIVVISDTTVAVKYSIFYEAHQEEHPEV